MATKPRNYLREASNLVTITLPTGHWKDLVGLLKLWGVMKEHLPVENIYPMDEDTLKAITHALRVSPKRRKSREG